MNQQNQEIDRMKNHCFMYGVVGCIFGVIVVSCLGSFMELLNFLILFLASYCQDFSLMLFHVIFSLIILLEHGLFFATKIQAYIIQKTPFYSTKSETFFFYFLLINYIFLIFDCRFGHYCYRILKSKRISGMNQTMNRVQNDARQPLLRNEDRDNTQNQQQFFQGQGVRIGQLIL